MIRVKTPKPEPIIPPEVATALSSMVGNAAEMARINKQIAEYLAREQPKRSYITEVSKRDAQGRIESLVTREI